YYLAQQAGGLTDAQFEDNAFQSNRERNWFQVKWLLYNVKLSHKFSEKTNFTFNAFGLNSERNALGYRGNFRLPQSNPVLDSDEFFNGQYDFRDLILGSYNNYGFETRLLSRYNMFNNESTFLIGAKYYNASNTESQGAGSRGINPDFNLVETNDYISSDFELPNENIALFGETILKFSEKFSVTPGFRFEYIKTQSNGEYTRINRDAAGNPIASNTFTDNRINDRNLFLLGIGASYKPNTSIEFYGNISQNYRSVTFSDIRTVNPSFLVDENISDERGQTIDIGVRGKWSKYLNYDLSAFGLFYNDRIGVILENEGPDKGDRLRTNIGDALIFGIESLVEWNVLSTFDIDDSNYKLTVFNNLSLITSEYTSTISRFGVEGNDVEFVPQVNLKNGLKFGYKNLLANVQFSYLSEQFSDASNAVEPDESGTRGKIPAYSILDVSLSYSFKSLKLETGINNLLDETYFTRRATGYPGPGIIPSAPRNWYVTLQVKI
ncbi:MAG: TonB-dependent receptor, partial [Algicola sp.]|nr:TonB-dependent receptor [Algicola sp.]